MNINFNKKFSFIGILLCFQIGVVAQLSQTRLVDLAEMKVERFQNILDMTSVQANQLKNETVKLLEAFGSVGADGDINSKFRMHLEKYYSSLTSFNAKQVEVLRLMDSMDRQARRQSYEDLLSGYGQSSDFSAAVAAYNWNVCIPILVTFRKDLDQKISEQDQAIIADMREKMIAKYNFIFTIRRDEPSEQAETIISQIQGEILNDLNESSLPRLLKKYEEHIAEVRSNMSVFEKKIKNDTEAIYKDYVLENHQNQISAENAFLSLLGVSKIMKDGFFLLMDAESRSNSFKINAIHLMANSLQITDQF